MSRGGQMAVDVWRSLESGLVTLLLLIGRGRRG